MIKLNRTTEYGLMALRHMSRKGTEVTSAREIADSYGLPFEITAKTLQRLRDAGLIQSAQGARGGYTLQRPLNDLNLSEFLRLMEGPQSVVACAGVMASASITPGAAVQDVREVMTVSSGCEYHGRCEIKHLMSDLNVRILGFLSGIRLSELAEGPGPATLNSVRPAKLQDPIEVEVEFQEKSTVQ